MIIDWTSVSSDQSTTMLDGCVWTWSGDISIHSSEGIADYPDAKSVTVIGPAGIIVEFP